MTILVEEASCSVRSEENVETLDISSDDEDIVEPHSENENSENFLGFEEANETSLNFECENVDANGDLFFCSLFVFCGFFCNFFLSKSHFKHNCYQNALC